MGAVPPGFVQSGFNSLVSVDVLDSTNGAPLTNASVSVNGTPLPYSFAFQNYEREVEIAPAQAIDVRIAVGRATYVASATQFSSYPTFSAPLIGATWSSLVPNFLAWSNVVPTNRGGSFYALGVLDTTGMLIWPSTGAFRILPTSITSFTLDPAVLPDGNALIVAGIGTELGIPHAAQNSSIIVGGFSYVPVIVTSVPNNTLMSITVTPGTPTIAVAGTRQLTATGSYSNGSTRDLTAQVAWSTSDSSKVSVSTTGLATGVAFGSATITATLGSVSGTATIDVFQPNMSPTPPLSQSVAYQIDYAHSGFATFGAPLSFPATPTWSVTLNGQVSYPLIAGGKVFVTTSSTGSHGYGTSLYALDKQTGNVLWGPVVINGTYWWSGHAYDHGKIFVVNFDGLLRSFDATTGSAGWSTQLPGQYAFDAPPTAVNGVVYVGGAGSGGTLYAVDASNGKVLWTAGVANGNKSSPAVSSDGVFVTYPCQAYKFDPMTGTPLWHYGGPCSGGGGRTAAYANGLLYMRDWSNPVGLVFDGATGDQVRTFSANSTTPIPAFSSQSGFFLNAGTLRGVDLGTQNVLWTFVGDGLLVSAPIVIDGTVIVGSSAGNIYAINAITGLQTWSGSAGSPISAPDEQNVSQPTTGIGAGEGYLIVPAGNVLTGWHLSGP